MILWRILAASVSFRGKSGIGFAGRRGGMGGVRARGREVSCVCVGGGWWG